VNKNRIAVISVIAIVVGALAILEVMSRVDSLKHLAPIEFYRETVKKSVTSTFSSSDTPDFKAMTDVKQKKQAFFDYFRPIIAEHNAAALKTRAAIEADELSDSELKELCATYRADSCTKEELLQKVDAIPESMVLAQAAIESAWGTSRFARDANNFFGQWCFTKGCGLVPSQRASGAKHEVQVFDTAYDAVSAYYRNINSHPAYKPARDIRHQARAQGNTVKGSEMVAGLLAYSGIGEKYVHELRGVIRVNNLEN